MNKAEEPHQETFENNTWDESRAIVQFSPLTQMRKLTCFPFLKVMAAPIA